MTADGETPTWISIHAFRVEGDTFSLAVSFNKYYFYPRPPGGGRPVMTADGETPTWISIHAFRVEGDGRGERGLNWGGEFLSTPSGWRATRFHWLYRLINIISIHALRVEGDCNQKTMFA